MSDKNYNPVTLGKIRSSGLDIFGYCHSCHRNRIIPSAMLETRLGAAIPVPKIGSRLKCTDCGSNDIYTRPHWPAVAEYNYPG